jgi:glycosyl transferase family 2
VEEYDLRSPQIRVMLDQITPLILTYNEASNIERNLQQLNWARDIVLIDSFSTDETVAIASRFPHVRVFQRSFDTHQQQWSFGLKETEIKTPWVLALDADYILTDELINELDQVEPANDIKGYSASFIYCIQGRPLRSGLYPAVTVLYRRDSARYEQDGHTQRIRVEGKVNDLHSVILHDDRKPLERWLTSQISYCELEAGKLLTASTNSLSFADRMRRWVIVAPAAMALYCLIVRGGVWDGWAGLQYALERTVSELMLSLYLTRNRLGKPETPPAVVDQRAEVEVASTASQFKVQSTKV